jgi:glycosyltransferase involved in cell wall biosynthesis
MTLTKPAVSVVIRAYNEERHIGKLMQGIAAQSRKDVEVILVDSGSTDQTAAIAAGLGATVVHIRPQDFSFGYSLNRGLAACRGSLVVIASAHVYPVYPDWLDTLLEPFADAQVACTYGKQRGTETSQYSEIRLFHQWFPDGQPSAQEHPFCNNANAAIRRELWEKNAYDETLPGLEDLDWSHRLMQQGYTVRYVPDAEVIHVHQETPAGIFRRYQREGMAFKRIFPMEHFQLRDMLRLSFSNIRSDCKAAAREKVLRRHWRDIIWFRVMQFWGTYQGYRSSGPLTWQLKQRFYYPSTHLPAVDTNTTRKVEPIAYNK